METIIQGMKFGKTTKEAYEILSKKYGWSDDMVKGLDEYGFKAATSIMDETHKVTTEGYTVWFLKYAKGSTDEGSNPNWSAEVSKDWNFIYDVAKNKEAWDNGKFNKLPIGHKVCIFVKDGNGDFVFMGIYTIDKIDNAEMKQTFKINLREYRKLNPF